MDDRNPRATSARHGNEQPRHLQDHSLGRRRLRRFERDVGGRCCEPGQRLPELGRGWQISARPAPTCPRGEKP